MGEWHSGFKHLLHFKSIEQIKTSHNVLSARNEYHRHAEHFEAEVAKASSIITSQKASTRDVPTKKEKVRVMGEKRKKRSESNNDKNDTALQDDISFTKTVATYDTDDTEISTSSASNLKSSLFLPYFNRAIAKERLKDIDGAINDYSTCLHIDNKHGLTYFNRGGLLRAKGETEKALRDLRKAVEIDPSNHKFHTNYALLLREKGLFMDAIQETIMARALVKFPAIAADVKKGRPFSIDSNLLLNEKLPEDALIKPMSIPKDERNLTNMATIIEFLKTLNFFSRFKSNDDVMIDIVTQLDNRYYESGSYIFQEGESGSHFYIIIDAEVSIVKEIRDPDDREKIINRTVLVKLFRGKTFGETALESKGGKRTAGALVSQRGYVLSLEADDYQRIMSSYKSVLQIEVEKNLRISPVFMAWEKKKLKHLASYFIAVNFAPHNVVIKAGSIVKNLFFIKKGIVKIVKNVHNPSSAHGATGDTSQGVKQTMIDGNGDIKECPGLWVLEKNWKESMKSERELPAGEGVDFVIGVLGSGQVFGELAVLDPEAASPVSYVTGASTELFSVDSETILAMGARFNTDTMNRLNESMSYANPTRDKLDFYFREKLAWELKKDKILGIIRHDMKHKKR